MFRFGKTRDIITLFHKSSVNSSVRVLNLLKQTSAAASETATIDQASDHSAQNKIQRSDFDLDITEAAPTQDQIRSIIDYVGIKNIGKVIKGASSEADALKKFKADSESFQRPVTVDWSNGKAVAGESESEIIKLVNGSQ